MCSQLVGDMSKYSFGDSISCKCYSGIVTRLSLTVPASKTNILIKNECHRAVDLFNDSVLSCVSRSVIVFLRFQKTKISVTAGILFHVGFYPGAR